MLPIIAIVGRPNVGKSTLFNRLTHTRRAIVCNMPGITRDRQYGTAAIAGRNVIVIDTGGIGEDASEMSQLVAKQSMLAVEEAHAIIFLVDARVGITPADAVIVDELRKTNKPIYLVANKVDGLEARIVTATFYELGLGNVYAISAEHGTGVINVMEKIFDDLNLSEKNIDKQHGYLCENDEKSNDGNIDKVIDSDVKSLVEESEGDLLNCNEQGNNAPIKIAILGRPNVGKSTLCNRMLGEERVVVCDAPGTTRDSIYVDFTRHGDRYILIDTAGIRKRGKISEAVEKFSIIKAMQAIEEANVVIMLLDAQENITEQDLRLLGFVLDAGKALVIAVNKWDGLPELQRDKIRSELERRLNFINFAKIYFISALHGTGVGNLFAAINKAYKSAIAVFSTSHINKLLLAAVNAYPPPMVNGRRIKLRYAHVGGHNPPTIIVHGNQTAKVSDSYRRYLEHYFLKALNLSGTPVRVEFKRGMNPYDKSNKGK